jgi:hypothetical protein
MSRVRHWFHAASDRKNITYIGIVVTALALACAKFEPGFLIKWPLMDDVCTIATALGTIVTALGKGIGDRRVVRTESEALENLRQEEN